MTFVEVYPGQEFLSAKHNGALDDGYLQKAAIGGFSRNTLIEKFMN